MGMLVNPFRHSTAGGDTLADLFSGGKLGDFWIGDAANTDGNVATDLVATATGTVNGLVMNVGDVTRKPQLEASGSVLGLRFNGGAGSQQRLIYNFGSDISQPMTLMLCLLGSDTTTHIMATGSSSTKRVQISNDSSDNIVSFVGASSIDSTINSPIGATAKVLTVEVNGATSNFWVDTTQTVTNGNLGSGVTNQLTIGSLWDGTFSCNAVFFSWLFINKVLSSAERLRAQKRLALCAGVTL